MNTLHWKLCTGLVLGVFAAFSQPLLADDHDHDDAIYEVVANDTLYGIARNYLISLESAAMIQQENGVRNPRRLKIGERLKIPRRLLRYDDVDLRVAALSGPVTIAGQNAATGMTLREGQVVTTGANGFVTFDSDFRGQVSLPSNTSARLKSARRYVLGNALDVDFAIERGRVNVRSPSLQDGDRLRMRTPVAVTAVRGTQYRVAYDPQRPDVSLTEVTEGSVNVAAGGEQRDAPAGFGIASGADGVGAPEELLPSPKLVNVGDVQTDETLRFAFEAVPNAKGYRFQIARAAGFVDVLSEATASDPVITLAGLENGRYAVRARAIAQSGLEGQSDEYSFLRKRLGVSGSAGAMDGFDGYQFAWTPAGADTGAFAFQLWADDAPDTLLIDETGLRITDLVLTDLTPGKYVWRVAVMEPDVEAGLIKVWGPANNLIVSN